MLFFYLCELSWRLVTDVKLSIVLSDQVLYSWGDKDIMRKVIVLSSCLPENVDSALEKTLMVNLNVDVVLNFFFFSVVLICSSLLW